MKKNTPKLQTQQPLPYRPFKMLKRAGTELQTSLATYFSQEPTPLCMMTDALRIAITINDISLERIALSDPHSKLRVFVLSGHNKRLKAKLQELLGAKAKEAQ